MKTKILWTSLFLLVVALPNTTQAQQGNRFLQLPVNELAQIWLLGNCGVGDQRQLEFAIIRQSSELKPLFSRALQQGAPKRLVNQVSESAVSRFRRNQAVLGDTESLGLSAENLERAKNRTAEKFINRSVQSFDKNYRTQARLGLALIDQS